MRTTNVFIYGSCVSRDTFEYLPSGRFSLVSYVARQSVISAFSPSRTEVDLSNVPSRFQRRMLEGDAHGNLPAALRDAHDRTDLVLWDLVDERLGVLSAPDGGHVTRTVEGITAGVVDQLPEWRLVEFGSDEHFDLWCASVDRFLLLLSRLGLTDRTLLLDIPWAKSFDTGEAAPLSFGLSAGTANERYDRYLRRVQEMGIAVASYRGEHVHTSAQHRWGPAPFHYTDATYRRAADAITRWCDREDPEARSP